MLFKRKTKDIIIQFESKKIYKLYVRQIIVKFHFINNAMFMSTNQTLMLKPLLGMKQVTIEYKAYLQVITQDQNI